MLFLVAKSTIPFCKIHNKYIIKSEKYLGERAIEVQDRC